jgi:hypothetical protein
MEIIEMENIGMENILGTATIIIMKYIKMG